MLTQLRPTALTRAFSGRLARGLVNTFQADHTAAAPIAYPELHHLTTPLRAHARNRGDAEQMNLWAGPPYDAEWQEAPTLPPEVLYELWYGTITRCREEWTALIAEGGLDVHCTNDPGYVVNRRRRLLDILEENLLHTGQTSIIREAIDGLTGNDPP